jgi:hypothetical protein
MPGHNAFEELNKEAEIAHGGKLLDFGNTVPSDGVAGFATGCIFMHTDGGDGTALFVNEGTASSADFNAITVA